MELPVGQSFVMGIEFRLDTYLANLVYMQTLAETQSGIRKRFFFRVQR